jgi:hypothetical protein
VPIPSLVMVSMSAKWDAARQRRNNRLENLCGLHNWPRPNGPFDLWNYSLDESRMPLYRC